MSNLIFGNIPKEYSSYENSRVVILPVPYEHTTSYLKGTARGPEAILRASYQIELFDEKLKQEIFRIGIHTLPFMTINSHSEKLLKQIEDEVVTHLNTNKLIVILGGEHTITLGALRGVKKFFPNIVVLQLDAHADLRISYQGNPYSHACVMHKVLNYAPLFQIGIRSLSKEEFLLIDEGKVFTLFAHEISPENLEAFISKLPEDIYLTIDMDSFDPAVVPGVGNPEPGGLNWEMADQILELISAQSRIRAFDIVELRPITGEVRSEVTAARLLYRLLGYISRNQYLP
jgi:agmatinase